MTSSERKKMEMKSKFGPWAGLFLVAGFLLYGGCTFVPFDYSDAGCVSLEGIPLSDQIGLRFRDVESNFEGTVVRRSFDSNQWTLEGNFSFPTQGYTVGEPSIIVRESWPEQVLITITFWSPKVISWVSSCNSDMPVTASFNAAPNAQITLSICNRPEPRCGCGSL